MGKVVQFDLSGSDGAPHSGATRRLKRLFERIWVKPASIDLFDDEPWSAVTRSPVPHPAGPYSTAPHATGRYSAVGTRWNTWGTHRPSAS
jgi:hypothetical protein